MSGGFLSVVVPAYNEAALLAGTLETVLACLRGHFTRFEVIVVDDGSRDATASIAEDFARRNPEVRVVRLGSNKGKGHAVRRGLLEARGDQVLFCDADLSTPIEEAGALLELLAQGCDMAIASRTSPRSEIRVKQALLRRVMGRVFSWLVRLFCGLPFQDTQCGFKCFTGRAAKELGARSRIDGFAFDVELLVLAHRLGLRVAEAPVRWANSPVSRVRILRHSTQMLVDLVRISLGDGPAVP